MIKMTEEEFIDLIIAEYEDWCNYEGEAYVRSDDKDEEELFDFVMCHIKIDGQTIEEMDDEEFEEWKEFFLKIDKSKIWDVVWEYNHPFNKEQEWYRNVVFR